MGLDTGYRVKHHIDTHYRVKHHYKRPKRSITTQSCLRQIDGLIINLKDGSATEMTSDDLEYRIVDPNIGSNTVIRGLNGPLPLRAV